jgi:hypothetical protein
MSSLALAPADSSTLDPTAATTLPDTLPMRVGKDATGTWHVLEGNLPVPIGFVGDIVWTIDEKAPEVLFAATDPIVFVIPTLITDPSGGKQFPGAPPHLGEDRRSVTMAWKNNAASFQQQMFTYYMFLYDPAITTDYPIRIDPTVENLPPG